MPAVEPVERRHDLPERDVLHATYCLSRCIKVFCAFFGDAFDRLAGKKPDSDLNGRRRIGLALTSHAEMILNSGMLLSLAPAEAWQTTNANSPKHITDVLFYSASTITTSGGGGFVPKGAIVKALTVFEIECGLILLVVCFAIYAGGCVPIRSGPRAEPVVAG